MTAVAAGFDSGWVVVARLRLKKSRGVSFRGSIRSEVGAARRRREGRGGAPMAKVNLRCTAHGNGPQSAATAHATKQKQLMVSITQPLRRRSAWIAFASAPR